AEVLLVHETVPGPRARPGDAESRDVLRIEPSHLRGQGERSPRSEDVPPRPVPGDHRLCDAGAGRRDGPTEREPRGHRRPGRPPPTTVRERRREALRGQPRFSPPRLDMDFDLSPEHEMIRQTARDFAEKEIRPVAARVDKTGEFPRATIARMAG